MKAKITDSVMDTMRQIALGESMHKDEEIKEAEHEEIEEAEEEIEEAEHEEIEEAEHEEIEEAEEDLEEKSDIPAKGKGGRITGGTARAVGALTGAGAGAAVGSVVPVVGTAVGGVLGGVGGYKMGRDAHRALYKEQLEADVSKAKQLQEEALAVDVDADAFAELSEDLAAVILESITPLAIRMDMIDEEIAAGTISEAEGGQKKGGLMKTAAAIGAGAGAAHLAARSGLLGDGAKEIASNVEDGAGNFVRAASDKFKSLKDASANSDAATSVVDTAKEKAGGIMSTIGNIVTGK